jgi:putative SOS response-associated peptidase YedK
VCGRYTLTNPEKIGAAFPQFRFEEFSEYRLPRFNIAPSQNVLGVRDDGDDTIEPMAWGLHGRINVRAESLERRRAPIRRRCILFADGFFEWHAKQPVYFTLANGEPFAFAGVWEPNRDAPSTCAIVTCEPNDLVSAVHDRMPVILGRDSIELWLAPEPLPVDIATSVLRPYDAAAMRSRDVSLRVNNAKYDAPDILSPGAVQQSLGL